MGLSARKRRSDDRRKRKRAAKAAKREQYAALAGTSKKGKRQSYKSVKPGTFNHAASNCGNPGCGKCYDQLVKVGTRVANVAGRLVIRPGARFDLAV
jgi:hypothetical protein